MAAPQFDAELHFETTTIMFADVVESVRLIEQDETENVRAIRLLLMRLAQDVAPKHQGTVLERRGDGLFVRFTDARGAAACALEFHLAAELLNVGRMPEQFISLRIGVHAAELLGDGNGLYGRGVNTAARIAALALPGGTVISANIRDQLTVGLDGDLEDMGDCFLKHLAEPIRAYRLAPLNQSRPWQIQSRGDKPPFIEPEDLRPTLAVLPFKSHLRDDEAGIRYGIGDVVTDQITAVLSRSASVNLISRLSTNAFKGRDPTHDEVREKLSADYVVSGRYAIAGEQLTVWIELSNAFNGKIVWADHFFGACTDVLSTESDLVQNLSAGVARAVMSSALIQARAMPLPNLPLHTLHLAAVTLLHRFSLADFERAHEMLTSLHERAPRHPTPLAWLARWHVFRVVQGWSNAADVDRQKGLDYSNRALDLDPESTLALTVAGSVRVNLGKQLEEAIEFYDRALAINPNEGLAWLLKGTARAFQVRPEEAIAACDRATHLSPLDPVRFLYDSLGATARLLASDFDGAIAFASKSIRANGKHASSYRALAISHSLKGELPEARGAVQKLLRIEPKFTLRGFVSRAPVNNPDVVQRYSDALRSAGLPE